MSFKGDNDIRDYINKSNRPYEVVKNIAKLAREKEQECNRHILHSEAITWVVQGIEPAERNKDQYTKTLATVKNENKLNELLSYVDDVEVSEAVKHSFIKSKHNKFMTFIYDGISDVSRQTRVRVLTRMLWYGDY